MTSKHASAEAPGEDLLDRFMLKPEVRHVTGLSSTTLWREEQAGRFPRSIPISPGRKGYLESQVRAWQQARIKAAKPSPHQRRRSLQLRSPDSYFGRGEPEAT